MALAKYGNKRDANEKDIMGALRAHGFSVVSMDTPADLLCGYGGTDYLVEVKTLSGTLTGPQEIFRESWRGSYTILRSVDDAIAWAVNIRSRNIEHRGVIE